MDFRKGFTGLILPLTVALTFSVRAYTQLIEVRVQLDTNTIQLGDQVNMKIEIEKPLGTSVIFPVFSDTLTGDIEILEKSELDSLLLKNNKVLLRQNLKLTVFDTGLFFIPPVAFVFHSENYTDSIFSSSNYLEVLSFPVDSTNTIRDIKSIYKVPVGFREIYPFILIFLGLLILGWVIWYIIKKKKHNEPIVFRAKPVDPPDVVAIRELDRLKNEKLWQQGKIKEYYSKISDILRIYIEGRFGIAAPEQTSYEILTGIRETLYNSADYEKLKSVLQLADLVKFAKANPEPDENVDQFENAYQFVLNTRHQQQADMSSTDTSYVNEKEKAEN
jgi:hypothetical protein